MAEAVERESAKPDNNFFEGKMVVTVEDWQPDLKRLTFTVLWEEIPEGSTDNVLQEADFEKIIFIHRDSGYHLLE
jgi:hypothetical protein